ncbi:unnamed protein product, partial [Thelazia callipaeda]|uniref:Kunitz/Bovine pancreatic trypsin inhibitor domain protein n=1 Tax=Thelazia callipaeda TaxID=103827 RepID=A0A0N5CJK9_THECL
LKSLIFIHVFGGFTKAVPVCIIGSSCDQCNITIVGQKCHKNQQYEHLYCNATNNKISAYANSYLICDVRTEEFMVKFCALHENFVNGSCKIMHRRTKRDVTFNAGSGHAGDRCSFDRDCFNGMFCANKICTCLDNYVAIHGFCYLKKNIGESGCQYSEQCSAVWPEARCENNICECPRDINGIPYVQARTRDGLVCILKSGEKGDPVPKCPLPEYDEDLLAMPVSQLRNPAVMDTNDSDIIPGQHINSLQFCSTTSTDYHTFVANGGGACTYAREPFTAENGINVADIYDCIGVPLNDMKSSLKGMYNIHFKADGICCPNRAFTCIQPKREVDSSKPTSDDARPRWWFNSITETCEEFLWDPWDESEVQSPNNFKTREHCESYCKNTCKRGSPQYSTEDIAKNDGDLITDCRTVNQCSDDFDCISLGSAQLCCPTTASICSIAGGRPFDPFRHTNFDPGYSIKSKSDLNFEPSIRYYYDSEQKQCMPFTYKGILGNFNNFKSSSDCESFCAKLQCPVGTALKLAETDQRCTDDSDCPKSHACYVNKHVCCPSPQTMCSQPLLLGDCKQHIQRYWYNAKTGRCELFKYSGCHGNDNNFETLVECQKTCRNVTPAPRCPQGDAARDVRGYYHICSSFDAINNCPDHYECYFDGDIWGCCPNKQYTCSLSSDKGVTCDVAPAYRFFYNTQTHDCEAFQYNGCDGNSNNFASRQDCERYCGVAHCPFGGTPRKDDTDQLVNCSSVVPCPNSYECTSIILENNVVNRCCPTRALICSLPPQQGDVCAGKLPVSHYYFDAVLKNCVKFTFNGCNGNLNNFATLEQCVNICILSACSSGHVVHVNSTSHMPAECKIGLSSTCPDGFECISDPFSDRSICCGAKDTGTKYLHAVDFNFPKCPSFKNNLHDISIMNFNLVIKYLYASAIEVCPKSAVVYKEPSTGSAVRCAISNGNEQCPLGFHCKSQVRGALQGYCCSSNNICPNNSEVYIEKSSHLPRTCTIASSYSCPAGYVCENSGTGSSSGYCCKNENKTVFDGCPPNQHVFSTQDNYIMYCDKFDPLNSTCPLGYSCQWSVYKQRYQCCGTKLMSASKLSSFGCPGNQVAYRNPITDSLQVCTVSADDCPIGFSCQFSATNGQFQCCGIGADCPRDQVAFVERNGTGKSCIPDRMTCPNGYKCEKTSSGSYLCCTNGSSIGTQILTKISRVCCSIYSILYIIVTVCKANQVLIGGFCMNRINIGSLCNNSKQCLGGSNCINGKCKCPDGMSSGTGLCKLAKKSSIAVKCPITGQAPYYEKGSKKIRYCSSLAKNCPRGYNCQYSRSIERNICCGRSATLNKVRSTNIPKRAVASTDVCNYGTPYILEGLAQTCTVKPCPIGFHCIFSKKTQNYYCCTVNIRKGMGNDGCPFGKTLLFPATGTPVQCNINKLESCPLGYRCVRSTRNTGYQCCTISQHFQDDISNLTASKHAFLNGQPCKNDQVQVKTYISGRQVHSCEVRCPDDQIAVDKICEHSI